MRSDILQAFHDEIGHWDTDTTKPFVLDRYRWPTAHTDIHRYVRGCDGCQRASPLPKYRTTLPFPLTNLFDTFSVDFAGPLPKSTFAKRYVLVGVEHLTGWPLGRATKSSSAEEVIKFVKEEVLYSFGPRLTIISDNATCFTAKSLVKFTRDNGIEWKKVLAYAPMSNGRAERMVGTLKKAVRKMVLGQGLYWEKSLPKVFFGYRRRRLAGGVSSFELMYGVPPRIEPADKPPLIIPSTIAHRNMELMATDATRATRGSKQSESLAPNITESREFRVGEEVLVAKGVALNPAQKWPALSSKFYGPCRIVRAYHPRYHLVSTHGRNSRRAIHARRLMPFNRKPKHGGN